MIIRSIEKTDWPAIIKIQHQAYSVDLHEEESVLLEKVEVSTETCFVAVDEDQHVCAYCLSHFYPKHQIPSLNEALGLKTLPSHSNIFLHDMAVSPSSHGKGVASELFRSLEAAAKAFQCDSISLVAVQNSVGYWQTKGFFELTELQNEAAKYGEGTKYMVKSLNAEC